MISLADSFTSFKIGKYSMTQFFSIFNRTFVGTPGFAYKMPATNWNYSYLSISCLIIIFFMCRNTYKICGPNSDGPRSAVPHRLPHILCAWTFLPPVLLLRSTVRRRLSWGDATQRDTFRDTKRTFHFTHGGLGSHSGLHVLHNWIHVLPWWLPGGCRRGRCRRRARKSLWFPRYVYCHHSQPGA